MVEEKPCLSKRWKDKFQILFNALDGRHSIQVKSHQNPILG